MFDQKRVPLYTYLPLETPFSLHVFPSFCCNFHCNYCIHSLSDAQLAEKHFSRQMMDLDLFKKAIDDLGAFEGGLKALIFSGHGEPLVNKQIAQMVRYAKQKHAAERIEIVTNGSLLTKGMSDSLINAGLDRLRISLQGMSAQKYREVAGVDLDYAEYVDNIRYFYEHRQHTQMYIKIIDIALDNDREKDDFYSIFSPISDMAAVEYAIPFVNEIDYGELSGKCKQGNVRRSQICSMPFYMLILCPDGNVVPCCSTEIPIVLGNIRTSSLSEIWNSKLRRDFLMRQLDGCGAVPVCMNCEVPAFGLQEGDYLDDYADKLKLKYEV